VLDPSPAPATASALTKLQQAFPAFGESRILNMWSGYIDVMPDALPVMDHVNARPGLFIATGFSGHGFGIGPAVGEAMAELIQGRVPSVDLAPFRLSRFA
jgi:glycine/D-amino acid oxidase-like deaminating enzyme